MTQKYQVKVSMKQAAIVETGIVLKQGDFGMQLEIEVLDFDATGTTPQIVFRKAMGAVESTTITVSGNKYTYTFVGTELDTPGKCFCDLKLKNSTTQRISTASFMFKVVADTLDGLAEESSSYSDTIAQIVGGFDGDIADSKSAANMGSLAASAAASLETDLVINPIMVQGNISGSGAEVDSTTRIRTATKIYVDNFDSVKVYISDGYKFEIERYKKDGTFSSSGWQTSYTSVDLSGVLAIHIVVAKSDNTDITPSENTGMYIVVNTKIAAEFADVAADYENISSKVSQDERVAASAASINENVAIVPSFVQGSISGTGQEIDSTTRIRTASKIYVGAFQSINTNIETGYKVEVEYYKEDGTFVASGWITGGYSLNLSGVLAVHFVVANTDNTNIDPSAGSNLTVTGTTKVSKHLSDNENNIAKLQKSEAATENAQIITSWDYINGNVSATGEITSSATRVCNAELILLHAGDSMKVESIPSGQKVFVSSYAYPGKNRLSEAMMTTGSYFYATEDVYVMAIWGKTDNSNISPSDITGKVTVERTSINRINGEQRSLSIIKELIDSQETADRLYGYKTRLLPVFTQGNISSAGAINRSNTTRIMTPDFIQPTGDLMIVNLNSDYSFGSYTYSSDGTFVQEVSWVDGNMPIPYYEGRKYRFAIRKNTNAEIYANTEAVSSIAILENKEYFEFDKTGYDSQIYMRFEQGSISSAGADLDSTSRIRTGYFGAGFDYRIELKSSAYSFEIDWYNDNGDFKGNYGWSKDSFDINYVSGYKYRMIIRKDDNSNITPVVANEAIKIYQRRASGSYPSYWDSYIRSKIKEVNAKKQELGKCINFIHISDLHYEKNAKHSPYLVSKIAKECGINYIFNTGDNVSPTGTTRGRALCEIYHKMITDQYKEAGCFEKYYAVMGNHDTNMQASIPAANFDDVIIQPREVYQMMVSSIEQHPNIKASDDGLVYYIDDEVQDVRYIVLLSNDSGEILDTYTDTRQTWGVRQDQLDFLIDALETSKHDIVIFAHIPMSSAEVKNYDIVKKVLEAYNTRGTYAKTNTFDMEIYDASVDVNFSTATKKVLAIFFGHDHVDKVRYYNGIVGVQIDTDSFNTEGEYTKTAGTISEQCFDVVCIDRESENIYCTRIGAGINRTISLNES